MRIPGQNVVPPDALSGRSGSRLRIRWLGRIDYDEAWALQRGLHGYTGDDYLLLMEHPHVFTYGPRTPPEHLPISPAGARLVSTDRGGGVTYHGPGQLVGYPVVSLASPRQSGFVATASYVHSLEELLIRSLEDLGLNELGRRHRHPGVWLEADTPRSRKLAAVGVRVRRGRTLHGFSLNVNCDLKWFGRIVPCGIREFPVTSLATEGVSVSMREVVDAVADRAVERWGCEGWDRADVAWRREGEPSAPAAKREPNGHSSLRVASGVAAGVASVAPVADAAVPVAAADVASVVPVAEAAALVAAPAPVSLSAARKPPWLRVLANTTPEFRRLRSLVRSENLATVCEEAGCPNIYECWAEGTATFMIAGRRCTRACGFCLVDTRRPLPLSDDEPERVADAVAQMNLDHAVITAVARDDLPDGGSAHFAATIREVRRRCPGTSVEVLIPDFKGDRVCLDTVLHERPDVLNHNLETVARFQRRVRPSAGYARSLALLARAAEADLTTKSSIMVGLGEVFSEVCEAMADLAGVGCDILTIGQYLQPSSAHLPVERWWKPEEFTALAEVGRSLGFAHVEASPLTRSSYHAAHSARSAKSRRLAVQEVNSPKPIS